MTIVNKSLDWIRNHFGKDKVNKFSIVVIMIYYYVGLLSYITVPIKPIYRLFTSGSSVAVIVRALMTAMMVLYCLLVVIVNKEKVQWKWAIVFIYVLLFTLLSTMLSPQTYNYVYVSSGNYQTIYSIHASLSYNRFFTLYFSSCSDFALAFCFLFILPFVFNKKEQVLLFLIPIVLIGVFECAYSLVVERGEYVKLLNFQDPQYGGYNVDIGATFGNKQDWGAFSNIAFISSLVSLVLLKGKSKLSNAFRCVLIVSSIIIFSFTVMSLCKTAIFADSIVVIILMLYLSYYLLKRSFVFGLIYSIILFSIFVFIGLFYSLESLHSSGYLKKIYDVTYNYIIKTVLDGASSGRTVIWKRLVENFRTYNLFFGLSKGGVQTYSLVVTVEGQSSIHNGLAYFFASYGVFGFSIYLLLLLTVIIRVMKVLCHNKTFGFLLVGIFVSAMVFSLSESEVLIVSGANPIFVYNILLCVIPEGVLKNYNETRIIYAN